MTIAGITALAQALGVPSIALFGVFIATAQLFIARQKLKLDLFEKRWAIFQALRLLMSEIAQHGDVREGALSDYLRGTFDAEFLFGDDVLNYLGDIQRSAIELQLCARMLSENLTSDRAMWANQAGNLMMWFMGQYNVIPRIFGPYMRFTHRDWCATRRGHAYAPPPLQRCQT